MNQITKRQKLFLICYPAVHVVISLPFIGFAVIEAKPYWIAGFLKILWPTFFLQQFELMDGSNALTTVCFFALLYITTMVYGFLFLYIYKLITKR